MKITKLYLSLFLLAIGFLIVTGYMNYNPAEEHAQTTKSVIKFSHKKHKDVAECSVCHASIEKSTNIKADVYPKMEDCSSCHDIKDTANCQQCHFDNVHQNFPAKKHNILFNHQSHLAMNKECNVCHKGVDEVDYASESPTYLPEMATCYTCHDGKTKATNACEACHVTTANLKPEDHKKNDFLRFHKFAAQSPKANCVMCHDNSSCDDCHAATIGINEKNSPKDFVQPFGNTQFIDGTKQQKITRVHDLNYRYTHGTAAKGREAECSSCHQTESFCVQCHNAERGDYNMGGVKPASHAKAGFTTLGVGTGGGEHAVLAKRDIENCVACHDVEGGDPVCITCHVDNNGHKGTHPKSHAKGAMQDLGHGDWHSDRSSMCYNCHMDSNARPDGKAGDRFCGYCHGSKRKN